MKNKKTNFDKTNTTDLLIQSALRIFRMIVILLRKCELIKNQQQKNETFKTNTR
jgi:hypothetical protein